MGNKDTRPSWLWLSGVWKTSPPDNIFPCTRLAFLLWHSYCNSLYLGAGKIILFTVMCILWPCTACILIACTPTYKIGRLNKIIDLHLIIRLFNYLIISSFPSFFQVHQKHQQIFITYIATVFLYLPMAESMDM